MVLLNMYNLQEKIFRSRVSSWRFAPSKQSYKLKTQVLQILFYLKQSLITNILQMKVYLLIATNLLLIAILTYFILDPSQDFKSIQKQPLCISTQNNLKLCAHCYHKDTNLLPNKGIKIASSEPITVLKVQEQQEYLSCSDYLQMINTQKDTNKNEVQLQAIPPIQQLLAEIKGSLQANKEAHDFVLHPRYSQFVIYKWGEPLTTSTKVLLPNPQQQTIIKSYFIYGFNFVLLVVLVAWIADSTFMNEQPTPIKLSLACIALLLQLYLFSRDGQVYLYLCRVFVLNHGLLRLKVNNLQVMIFFAVGLLVTYFQLTLPFYVFTVLVLMYFFGNTQLQSKDAQIYLVAFYTLMLFNHIYLYQNVYLLNDFKNTVIELCTLIVIPLGLFLLPNSKLFRPYHPVDPEIRSISLSGYDQEEPTTI